MKSIALVLLILHFFNGIAAREVVSLTPEEFLPQERELAWAWAARPAGLVRLSLVQVFSPRAFARVGQGQADSGPAVGAAGGNAAFVLRVTLAGESGSAAGRGHLLGYTNLDHGAMPYARTSAALHVPQGATQVVVAVARSYAYAFSDLSLWRVDLDRPGVPWRSFAELHGEIHAGTDATLWNVEMRAAPEGEDRPDPITIPPLPCHAAVSFHHGRYPSGLFSLGIQEVAGDVLISAEQEAADEDGANVEQRGCWLLFDERRKQFRFLVPADTDMPRLPQLILRSATSAQPPPS